MRADGACPGISQLPSFNSTGSCLKSVRTNSTAVHAMQTNCCGIHRQGLWSPRQHRCRCHWRQARCRLRRLCQTQLSLRWPESRRRLLSGFCGASVSASTMTATFATGRFNGPFCILRPGSASSAAMASFMLYMPSSPSSLKQACSARRVTHGPRFHPKTFGCISVSLQRTRRPADHVWLAVWVFTTSSAPLFVRPWKCGSRFRRFVLASSSSVFHVWHDSDRISGTITVQPSGHFATSRGEISGVHSCGSGALALRPYERVSEQKMYSTVSSLPLGTSAVPTISPKSGRSLARASWPLGLRSSSLASCSPSSSEQKA